MRWTRWAATECSALRAATGEAACGCGCVCGGGYDWVGIVCGEMFSAQGDRKDMRCAADSFLTNVCYMVGWLGCLPNTHLMPVAQLISSRVPHMASVVVVHGTGCNSDPGSSRQSMKTAGLEICACVRSGYECEEERAGGVSWQATSTLTRHIPHLFLISLIM